MASEVSCWITQAPDLVLLHIAAFLPPRDVAHLAQTCRRFYVVLPRFLAMKGEDFHLWGHPEKPGPEITLYFDGPPLPSRVSRLVMSVVWVDQGWGYRKGEIYITLMRGERQVTKRRKPLGTAKHEKEAVRVEVRGQDPLVAEAKPGDFYRFTRIAGGGGGHQLMVQKFRVVVQLI